MKREKSSLASIKNAHRKKKWKRTSSEFSHLSEATFSFPSPSAPQAEIGNKRFSLLTVAIVEPEEMNESAGAAEIFRENSAGDLQNFLSGRSNDVHTRWERGWRGANAFFWNRPWSSWCEIILCARATSCCLLHCGGMTCIDYIIQ